MKIKEAQNQFEFFQAELSAYIFRLVTHRELTEDVVQDTFLKVIDKLETFEGKSSFKTWVFTIATNIAKNHLQKKNRWETNYQDYGAMLHVQSKEHWTQFNQVFESTPDQQYDLKEHLAYCFNCINKTLIIEQQICLLLKEVYDFKVNEIIQITDLSEGKVKHALANARKNMTKIFDNRCAFVNQKGVCHQCTELTGMLNPAQDVHQIANELKLVKKGKTVSQEKLLELRLELIKVIDPLQSNDTEVNIYMLENLETWVKEGKEKKVL